MGKLHSLATRRQHWTLHLTGHEDRESRTRIVPFKRRKNSKKINLRGGSNWGQINREGGRRWEAMAAAAPSAAAAPADALVVVGLEKER
jgi:hypothetical protein